MFRVDDHSGEEVVLDTTTGEDEEQIIEDVSTDEPFTTTGELVTTVADKVSAASTTDVTEDEITMAQALASLKSTKPKVVLQEKNVSTTILAAAITVTTAVPTPRAKGIVFHKQKQSHIPTVSSLKDKGKDNMIEPEVPIKNKYQMKMDEDGKEAQESSTKRTTESLKSDISKKQKVDENNDPLIDDTEELKKCMEIVSDDGDTVLIEATPISSRSPTIIDYKIHKEGKKNY
nr:hypothetical protein [Tanacetum cinerariifolium]